MKATSDKYIHEVTIGGAKPLNSTIQLSPYNPEWPLKFLPLAAQIKAALREKVLLLEHVGSTSVEGLSAKPIIDMVLVVADSADEKSYIPYLEKYGFVLRIREPDWFRHRLLKAPDSEGNLHVFSERCDEVNRMLVFRNWLRLNDTDRILYENTKRELAARKWKYTQDYADAKSEVIQKILARALNAKNS